MRQLSVTAPATLPAGCSTPSTQALSNSSLPNAAGHRVDRHPPKQLQQQQTVTQPLRSVHHAGHSEAAAALLQTGAREDVTDAGGQPTADCRVAFDALCGSIKSRPGHVESSSMTRSVGTHEKPEVGAHVMWQDKNSFVSKMTQKIWIRLVEANIVSCHTFVRRKCCLRKHCQWLCMVGTTFDCVSP